MLQVDPTWIQACADKKPFWLNFSWPPENISLYCDVDTTDHLKILNLDPNFQIELKKENNSLLTNVSKNSEPLFSHKSISSTSQRKAHNKKVSLWCFDATQNLEVSGFSDGSVKLYAQGSELRDISAHVLDVNVCRFFPSGQVLLTGGGDMQLKIWDLKTGLLAATFKGHRSGVLSCDFIDRGRNVLSSGRHGVNLWDVPTQSIIHQWDANPDDQVHQATVWSHGSIKDAPAKDSRDVATEGKLVLVASDRSTRGYDLRQRNQLFDIPATLARNTIQGLINSDAFVSAGDGGLIQCWDIRNIQTNPLRELQFGTSINFTRSLSDHNGHTCWLGASNGMVFNWDINHVSEWPHLSCVNDHEPIYGLASRINANGTHQLISAQRNATVNTFQIK